MLRILGGQWRGRKLQSPKGLDARPTLGRTREAIFSMLMEWTENARALDLFAGAGALGFEALSRGAAFCQFMDNHRERLGLIARSARTLGCEERIAIVRAQLPEALAKNAMARAPFNIVFLDPPYEKGLITPTLQALVQYGWLALESVVMAETRRGEDIVAPAPLALIKDKLYGDTQVRIYLFEPDNRDRKEPESRTEEGMKEGTEEGTIAGTEAGTE